MGPNHRWRKCTRPSISRSRDVQRGGTSIPFHQFAFCKESAELVQVRHKDHALHWTERPPVSPPSRFLSPSLHLLLAGVAAIAADTSINKSYRADSPKHHRRLPPPPLPLPLPLPPEVLGALPLPPPAGLPPLVAPSPFHFFLGAAPLALPPAIGASQDQSPPLPLQHARA